MAIELKARLKLKRNTESNWISNANEIFEGEPILVKQTKDNKSFYQIKIGDGSSNYSNLPFSFLSLFKISTTGSGNGITSATVDTTTGTLTFNKGSNFLTSHANGFGKISNGTSIISANASNDTLTLVAGSNTALTYDTTNKKITFSSSHPSISISTNSTSTSSPLHGGTFTAIDSITKDSYGHTTKINTKTVKIPSIFYHSGQEYKVALNKGTDLNWYKICDMYDPIVTAPESSMYHAATISGNITLVKGNHNQAEPLITPFSIVFYSVSGKAIKDEVNIYIPKTFTSDCLRVVKVSTNHYELQARINNTYNICYLDYGYSAGGVAVTPQEPSLAENSDVAADISSAKPSTIYNFALPTIATTNNNGLMSKEDKVKLNGIAVGAEVNQNAFSNIVVGSTTLAADSKTDTLTLVAGSNVTLTPDADNDKVTIAAKDTTYNTMAGASAETAGKTGLVPAPATGERGLYLRGDGRWAMPPDTKYTLPTASATTLGGIKVGENLKVSSGILDVITKRYKTIVVSNYDNSTGFITPDIKVSSTEDLSFAIGNYINSSNPRSSTMLIGYRILLLNGTYTMKEVFPIKRCILEGENKVSTIIKISGRGINDGDAGQFIIKNLTLQRSTSGACITVGAGKQFLIDNVIFEGNSVATGIIISSSVGKITNCYFYSCSVGISSMQNGSGIIIEGCHFYGAPTGTGTGISTYSGVTNDADKNIITHNIFEYLLTAISATGSLSIINNNIFMNSPSSSTITVGIELRNVSRGICSNNIIKNAHTSRYACYGIKISSSLTSTIISNNSFFSNSSTDNAGDSTVDQTIAIKADSSSAINKCIIQSNIVRLSPKSTSATLTSAIDLYSIYDSVITGNIFNLSPNRSAIWANTTSGDGTSLVKGNIVTLNMMKSFTIPSNDNIIKDNQSTFYGGV